MEWQQFLGWAFQGLIAGCVAYGVAILSKMSKSIEELNKHVAILLERDSAKQYRLDDHETRLRQLEKC